jgi:hypothetical protein
MVCSDVGIARTEVVLATTARQFFVAFSTETAAEACFRSDITWFAY